MKPDSWTGARFGSYEITSLLGAGGMGEVYRAKDLELGRDVAIKVLRKELASEPEGLKRFEREARTASALNHPNITTIYHIGDHEGTRYIVMEYVEGKTLRELLGEGPLPSQTLLRLASQIAEGLDKAHSARIVHRDLKPENLMVTGDGLVKILDFGLAKLTSSPVKLDSDMDTVTKEGTRQGTILGTVQYMSPEQASGRAVDYRSDQFSLGLILYEMATGKVAFQRDTSAATLAAIIEGKLEPMTGLDPSLAGSFRQTVERCLVKEPDGRYASTGELAKELEQARDGVRGVGVWLRRSAMFAMVGMFAALVAAVGLNVGEIRDQLLGEVGGIQSVAVLPLRNVSGDPEQEYFSDGMTEALISDLAKIGALKVISRTSAMRYKRTEKTLPEIARELNVDAVLEGSVLLEGERVRITAQLIAAETDQNLWADNYERDLRDIMSVQGEVARAIAQAIQIQLTPEETTLLASARPVNPETYEAYLKGMFYLNKFTPEGFEKGLGYLLESVKNDPADPLAYAGLALGYSPIGSHNPAPTPDAFPKARAAALKALELDETSAEAHAALAQIKLYKDWDWAGAEKAFRRALEINPNLAEARAHYAWYLNLFGRQDEALAEMKRAQQVDPLTPTWTAWMGDLNWTVGQYDKTIEFERKALELNPDFPWAFHFLGLAYAEKGMYEEAIAAHQKAVAAVPNWRWGLAHTYALAGRRNEARKMAAELEEEPKPENALGLTFIYTALGEKDEAIRWAEAAAYKYPHPHTPWLLRAASFEPLRDDPRFQDLLRRMNLPQ